jgi:hypothetical protein
MVEFANGQLFWCTIYPVKGSPAYVTPISANALSTAKDTLNRLQTFSAKDYLPALQNMLSATIVLQNSKTSTADYTQEIATSGNTIAISWEPFANGLSNSQNKLTIEFKNGNLMFFSNYLGMYTIGNTDVNISKQQAIEIATEHAQAYSYVQGNETVSNITVLSSPVIANLTLQNRGNATLYPLWDILLPLDKMYPGGVTSFHVSIWADTGEIQFITPTGAYGIPNAVDPPSGMTTQQQPTSNNSVNADYSFAIAITLIAATTVIVSYLFYKRKR